MRFVRFFGTFPGASSNTESFKKSYHSFLKGFWLKQQIQMCAQRVSHLYLIWSICRCSSLQEAQHRFSSKIVHISLAVLTGLDKLAGHRGAVEGDAQGSRVTAAVRPGAAQSWGTPGLRGLVPGRPQRDQGGVSAIAFSQQTTKRSKNYPMSYKTARN